MIVHALLVAVSIAPSTAIMKINTEIPSRRIEQVDCGCRRASHQIMLDNCIQLIRTKYLPLTR